MAGHLQSHGKRNVECEAGWTKSPTIRVESGKEPSLGLTSKRSIAVGCRSFVRRFLFTRWQKSSESCYKPLNEEQNTPGI